jgi:hypothetical protein
MNAHFKYYMFLGIAQYKFYMHILLGESLNILCGNSYSERQR